MGFCFGSGQLLVGIVTLILAASTLWLLKCVERRMDSDRQATLVFRAENGPTRNDSRRVDGGRIAGALVGLTSGTMNVRGGAPYAGRSTGVAGKGR